jgi:hypothetical protein
LPVEYRSSSTNAGFLVVRLTLLTGLLLLAAFPASATETVTCAAADGSEARVEMNLSGVDHGHVPNWVRVNAGGNAWSTLEGDAGALPALLQPAADAGAPFGFDLADKRLNTPLVSLRLLDGREGDTIVRAGYLRIHGTSIHPIVCDFGDSE